MRISLLNLISTPVPVLNSLGVDIRVGLSSEDPMVMQYHHESYEAFLSIYSPEGIFLERRPLGEIPPERRRFFDISTITGQLVPGLDHLTVVHRVPSRLLSMVTNVEDEIELSETPDFPMFRSLVEFSFPGGGHGSLIYETPPRLNAVASGGKSSNTLTFTCQTVLSDLIDSHLVLIHYSTNPAYSNVATYHYALHSLSGEMAWTDSVAVAPFSIKVLDLAQLIPDDMVEKGKDPQDGLSSFTLVGHSEDAAMLVLVVNTAPSLGAISVEHTHPTQGYLFPKDSGQTSVIKMEAQAAWSSIMSAASKK